MLPSDGNPAGPSDSFDIEPLPIPTAWGLLLSHLPVASHLCDSQGFIRYYNQAAVELWGRRPQIGVERGSGALRLLQVDGQPLSHEQSLMTCSARGREKLRDKELIVERPDGSRRNVRMSCNPIFAEDGTLLATIHQAVDGRRFDEMDHAQARLAAIIESSDDAIISKNLDGVIMSWNQAAERLFGYRAEEALGRPITILIPEDRLDEEPQVLARIRRGELVDHFETVRRRKDGTLVDISLTISPIRGPNNAIIGASKIARNITDRKEAERLLADADRKKDEFIAVMAHELRNPLAPLKTSLHLIQANDGQIPRGTVEMMQRQVGHLIRLVDDLLDISRFSHGTIVLKKESVSLDDIVSDALEIGIPKLEAKGHQLEVHMPSGLRMLGDRTRLTQVLANLLNNAAKFTPNHGLIKLIAEPQGEHLLLRVRDNGIGIAAKHQQGVFGMFSRVDGAGDAESGLGIGLALAHYLVTLHGGSISLHSDGPGTGTEFTVSLPLGSEGPSLPAPQSQPRSPLDKAFARRRILIVDDNKDAADSLQMLFELLGHEAAVALSGHEGLALARSLRPDIVLLDIGLPDLSGNDVAMRMRQEDWAQSAILVALTGWGEAAVRERSAAAGFDHHFLKPVDLDALERLLERPLPVARS